MTNEENIIIWSDKILQFLLDKRKENPDLRFWLRRANNKGRLDKGIWFQGDEKYIFVGFSKRGAGNLSTKSIGFVVWFDDDFKPSTGIEIIFKNENDQQLVDGYRTIAEQIKGLKKNSDIHFVKMYDTRDVFESLNLFLTIEKPIIDKIIKEKGLEDKLFIDNADFEKSLIKILEIREKQMEKKPNLNVILVNITWNSKDWKEPTTENSAHKYVAEGGLPHESWNFDFNNPRNTESRIFGHAQFTATPRISGQNNLIIFYSNGKIVGFYGKAEVFDSRKFHDGKTYNLSGDKHLSLVLNNKIDNVKEKGYLEGLKRVGQIGFSYLRDFDNIMNIIDEAIRLNPEQQEVLNRIKNWVLNEEQKSKDINNDVIMDNIPLNQIFFGPPGTGKTFSTVDEAVKIVDPEFYQLNKGNRDLLRAKYEELIIKDWDSPKGNIGFCTFHQSFSYEDFVEGIKPLPPEENNTHLKYDIVPGIFKSLVRLAESGLISDEIKDKSFISLSEEEFNKSLFYKVSLGNTNIPEEQKIYDYCIENNYISVGFGVGIDFTGKNETEVNKLVKENNLDRFTAQVINYFKNYVKIGDYVIVSKGNYIVRAIGKVKGEYTFVENSPIEYNHFREVEWLFVNEEIPVQDVYEKVFSQQTIYKLNHSWIKKEFFYKSKKGRDTQKHRNYVLIIDEINRGNISQIFGELITLIEKDKRKGGNERTQVVLPYSHEAFSVPSNLFIIGTMNTADRSIEALDTALRRRFSFREIAPDSNIIAQKGKSAATEGIIDNIDLVRLLNTINDRIEKLLDKDHQIGHSYFMKVHTFEELVDSFKDEIIPLLQEYFYGDFGKIGLVLGNEFVRIKYEQDNDFSFAKFKGYDTDIISDLKQRKIYEITPSENWTVQAFQSVYSGKNQE